MNTLTCRSKCNILRYWIYLTIMNKQNKKKTYTLQYINIYVKKSSEICFDDVN